MTTYVRKRSISVMDEKDIRPLTRTIHQSRQHDSQYSPVSCAGRKQHQRRKGQDDRGASVLPYLCVDLRAALCSVYRCTGIYHAALRLGNVLQND